MYKLIIVKIQDILKTIGLCLDNLRIFLNEIEFQIMLIYVL